MSLSPSNPDQFQYVLKKIEEVSEIIEFEGDKNQLQFVGSDARATRAITIFKKDLSLIEYEPEGEHGSEASAHSLTFLKSITSYSQLLEDNGVITFFIKRDNPIKVIYEIDLTQVEQNQNRSYSKKVKETPIGTFKAITYLAPRIPELDSEGGDEEDDDDF